MILEKPLLGWQTVNWFYELDSVLAGTGQWSGRDAHNLLLVLFLEVGIMEQFPTWLDYGCAGSGMEGARGRSGAAPISTSEYRTCLWHVRDTLRWKPQWLVSALALASAFASSASNGSERVPVVLRRQPIGVMRQPVTRTS